MTVWQKARYWFKTLMSFSTSNWSVLSLGRTRYDYAAQVGDGRGNSAIEACIRWIGRTFPEAPIQLLRVQPDGTEAPVTEHPMLDLLTEPNPYYSGELLWRATLADWAATGNGYWLKVRNRQRAPLQLWWAPASLVTPAYPNDDPTVFISHYEYRVNGQVQVWPVEDVIHFRDGIDPRNPRLGLSPVAALAREIFTDDEAANMTASLVRNMGVPGVIIAPEDDAVELTKSDGQAIKDEFKNRFGGDNRGEPMVMPAKTKVSILSWSPEQMNLRALRRIPEERVCAMLGIPAIVVGLGAGLDRATYANMAEAREAAYESYILPNQRLFGADLRTQLLRDYGDIRGWRVGFDTRNVRVLQEDENKKWIRVNLAVRGGWLTVARGKELVGETPDAGDNVYLRSAATTATGPDAQPEPEPESDMPSETDDDDQLSKGQAGVESKATSGIRRQLQRSADRLAARMAGDIDATLEKWGAAVRIAVTPASKVAPATERKLAGDDWQVIRETWLDGQIVQIEIPTTVTQDFQTLYEANFKHILETTLALIESELDLPVGINLPDYRAREIIRGWATRKGLVDLNQQALDAVMLALEEGRIAGDGADDLARRIRGMVEGRGMYPGVYRDAYERAKERGWGDEAASRAGDRAARQYRAETIARTETKTAQNRASIEAYRASDVVEALKVWDGDDCGWTTHDDPDLANGKVVSFAEADAYPLAHPRCLRSFGPVVRKTVA